MADTPAVVTPIPDFPALSDRADGTYNSKAFAWATHMGSKFVPEVNAAVGAMSSFAAGGAYSFPYAFDSATADADPGLGRLRLNTSTQNAATVMRVDQQMVGGASIAAFLDALGAGSSVIKGSIRLVKVADPTSWMLFDVLAVAAPTGYRNLTVVHRASSSASPFSGDNSIMVYIDRAGDKGEDSSVLPTIRVTHRLAAGTQGGSSTGASLQRAFNTVDTNTIPGASLASNTVTLPAGSYKVRGSAPAIGGSSNLGHQIRIIVPLGSIVILGTSEAAAATNPSRSFVEGFFSIGASSTVQMHHFIQVTQAGYGQGLPAGGGTAEIYAEMTIEKIS